MSTLSRFTINVVNWRPWVETIDEIEATEDQLAAVAEVAPNSPTGRVYWATLGHDAPALRARQKLFRESLVGGEGGSPRPDRELAAVATSRVNGCAYCASVHARAHAQLTRSPELIQRLLDEGIDTELPAHERALVDYAVKLTQDPASLTKADLTPLREAGFLDTEILDVTYATAMFAWANRLLQTLGSQHIDEAAS
jgi:uncharacterized peroxidase-related enzyme